MDNLEVSQQAESLWGAHFPPMAADWATIVIPNYNHARYLPDAIESGLAQDYPLVEMIVVDDGSTDHSREVIERYPGLISPIFQANQGLSAARNSGILAAKGEFICVLDADDMLEPRYLSILIERLRKNPEAAAVTCGYHFVSEDNQPLPQHESRAVAADQLFEALLAGNFLVPESILVRRRAYEAAGPFDRSLRACEDLDMWLRISGREPVICERSILTRHRILAGSMSTDPQRMHTNRLRVFEKHLAPLVAETNANSSPSSSTAKQFSKAYVTSVVEFLQVGRQDTAFDQMKQAVIFNPALLDDPAVFYELILGDQPKGWRGDFASARPRQGYEIGVRMLTRLFAETDLPAAARARQKEAFAHLALAAGLISYGQSEFSAALGYFGRAVAHKPAFLLKKPLLTRLLKILLGFKQLQRLMAGQSPSQP